MIHASRTPNPESRKILIFLKIRIFLEMIKFEHSIFALPFAYLGMVLAATGWPGWNKFFWITLAMISFRTMAMAANRLIDELIDALNPRTVSRALPAGLLKRSFVWLAAGFSLGVFVFACKGLNPLCLKLAIIPIILAWVYPYMKRLTLACHFLLGLVLGMAPYGAWLAVKPEFSWIPGFLMLGVLFWVAGFDIIYALLDLDFDREKGLHSAPSKMGISKSKILAASLHVASLLCWIEAGFLARLNTVYFLGITLAAILMLREHVLVSRNVDTGKINQAFFTLNAWISLIVFISAWLGSVT